VAPGPFGEGEGRGRRSKVWAGREQEEEEEATAIDIFLSLDYFTFSTLVHSGCSEPLGQPQRANWQCEGQISAAALPTAFYVTL